METYGEWQRIKPEDVEKRRQARLARSLSASGQNPLSQVAQINAPFQPSPDTRVPRPYTEETANALPPMLKSPERKRGLEGLVDYKNRVGEAYTDLVERGKQPIGARTPLVDPGKDPGEAPGVGSLPEPEAPLPIANQNSISQVAQLPLEGGGEATKITRPDGSTRWTTKNGYMDAATPKATSTDNALGITKEAFSPGGSFSVASGPRGGLSQAEWDGLSQEEATAIRVAEIEKKGAALRGLSDVRSAADFKAGGPLTEGGRSVLEEISGGAPIEGYTRGTKSWRQENNTGAPTIVGTSFADDFAFADQAGGGLSKIKDALRDENPRTRREAIDTLGGIYKAQMENKPQAVGPDFGDQLAQAQMQQDALFKKADLKGEQQDRTLNREQQALENRRAGAEAEQAEVEVLTAQLDKVMGSGQVVSGTEGVLNEVMLQKRASPLMVNGIIQEALMSLPNAREVLANPDNDPDVLKDKQAALAAIRKYVAQKMP